MRQLVLVRHGDDVLDDRVVTFALQHGLVPSLFHPFKGEALPDPGPETAGVVHYGGPFSVFEEAKYPFLLDEARLIRACLARDMPLLGICQGAQQIARVLGAHVGPPASGLHEFGYYTVTPTPEGRDFLPEPLRMTQSHFHHFDLPSGAERLAYSDSYPNQAFRYGARCYGLQFHPECTIEGFRRWQDAPWARFGQPGAQSREEQDNLMLAADAAQARWFYGFLTMLFAPNGP